MDSFTGCDSLEPLAARLLGNDFSEKSRRDTPAALAPWVQELVRAAASEHLEAVRSETIDDDRLARAARRYRHAIAVLGNTSAFLTSALLHDLALVHAAQGEWSEARTLLLSVSDVGTGHAQADQILRRNFYAAVELRDVGERWDLHPQADHSMPVACRAAVGVFQRIVVACAVGDGDFDAALAHAEVCEVCARRFACARPRCEHVIPRLQSYAEALVTGGTDNPRWARVVYHLSFCDGCAEELQVLAEADMPAPLAATDASAMKRLHEGVLARAIEAESPTLRRWAARAACRVTEAGPELQSALVRTVGSEFSEDALIASKQSATRRDPAAQRPPLPRRGRYDAHVKDRPENRMGKVRADTPPRPKLGI